MDRGLTSTSLGYKEAVSSINKAFQNFVTSSLHSGMCKKSKLRVYRELKEDFECKKYLHGVSDMGSKLLFRFRSGTHGLNEELGRHSSRNSSCESVEHVLWECSEYRSICKECIGNFDGFLQNDFHLKSSLIRLNTFLIRVLGNVMVTLIIVFQILRLFCVAYGICIGRNFILQVHMIKFCTAPSIDTWSMVKMLWQCIHEIFILFILFYAIVQKKKKIALYSEWIMF